MEHWKSIPEYEGLYEASDLGRIRSLPRATTSGKILKPYVNKHNGYCYVTLSKNNVRKQKRVHKLVMISFCEIDESRPQINHVDGDKTNNKLDNLKWCTQSENMKHAYENGLELPPTKNVIDLDSGKIYDSVTDAARSTGKNNGTGKITMVCQGKRSHYRGRRFAYLKDYENGTIPKFSGKWKKGKVESLWR